MSSTLHWEVELAAAVGALRLEVELLLGIPEVLLDALQQLLARFDRGTALAARSRPQLRSRFDAPLEDAGIFVVFPILDPVQVQILDAMYLLGHVREVEVDREGPDEVDGVDDAEVLEHGAEILTSTIVTLAPQLARQRAYALDLVEQSLAFLADQCLAELSAESANVRAKSGVEMFRCCHPLCLLAGST